MYHYQMGLIFKNANISIPKSISVMHQSNRLKNKKSHEQKSHEKLLVKLKPSQINKRNSTISE